MLFTIHDSKPSCYSTLLALIAGRETPQNLYQTTLRQISSVVNLKSCTESVMARHVGAAAVSRVLRVRTRFESRMGMRYSTNALNRFHLSLSLCHTHNDCALPTFCDSACTVTLSFLIGGFVVMQPIKISRLTLFQNSYWACLTVRSRRLQQYTDLSIYMVHFRSFFFY
jgi:hypothetical protein